MNNGLAKTKVIYGLPWSKCVIERKAREQTSAIACVLRSTTHMSLCLMSSYDTWWAITACKAPPHSKGGLSQGFAARE